MNLADPNCRSCKNHGLNFPDNTRACQKHTTPEWRDRLTDLDARAKKILPAGRWPYGPNVNAQARIDLVEWAEPLGVQESTSRCNGLHWLRKGMCSNSVRCNRMPWMDHTTHWKIGGKPALTLTQPYRSAEQQREAMADLLDAPDLLVEVKPGWYGHGTIGAFVWRKDAHEELFG